MTHILVFGVAQNAVSKYSSLYNERGAILLAIKEGIIAVDFEGAITMINTTAKKILGVSDQAIGRKIEELLPHTKMYEVLKNGEMQTDQELKIGEHTVIVNRTPIIEKNKVIGVVASFRDKTEIQEMVNTLSEVRKYSEDLRDQTHEYTNKTRPVALSFLILAVLVVFLPIFQMKRKKKVESVTLNS